MGCQVGQDVGYCVRFEERMSRDTRIVYLTGERTLHRDHELESYFLASELTGQGIDLSAAVNLSPMCLQMARS